MLILSRDISQSIIVGDDVEIMILGVKGGQVKIGIAAPKSTTVHRKEVWIKIQKEKQEQLRKDYLNLLTEHGGEDDGE